MRAFRWLIIVSLVVIAAVYITGLMLPDTVRVERTITVRAKPATVYVALNGFKRFTQWAPWTKLDPKTQYTFDGPPWGVGAKLTWSSEHPSVGHGSQEIVEATPYTRIRSRLVFSGFDSENYSELIIAADGDGSRVSWAYEATFHGNLLGRFFALKLDDWVGKDYEQGLLNLKLMVEALADVGDDPLAGIGLLDVPASSNVAAYSGYVLRGAGAAQRDQLEIFRVVAGLDRNGEAWLGDGADEGTAAAVQNAGLFMPVK